MIVTIKSDDFDKAPRSKDRNIFCNPHIYWNLWEETNQGICVRNSTSTSKETDKNFDQINYQVYLISFCIYAQIKNRMLG